MRRTWIVVMLVVCCAQGMASAESIPNETAWAAGTNWEYKTSFLGFPSAWVYVPDSTSSRVPGKRAVVFHLLGCGQMAFQMAQGAGWPEPAEAQGFVVVIPALIDPVRPNPYGPKVECLNYGYQEGSYLPYEPSRNDPDHAAIIAAGQDIVTQHPEYEIDPNQVYVAGMSAGGGVAVQVACMAPEVFAGVGIVAAPGIGSSQATAVMAPSISAQTIVNLCNRYSRGSSHPDADALLAQQVFAIISDNNGMRPGHYAGDVSMFENQSYWDGDKFCPHAYKPMAAEAMITIAGLSSSPTESQVQVANGEGKGCQGGEASQGDSGEVSCLVKDSVQRDWTAYADLWKDADGHVRVARIEQDTLRHTWPSGPVGWNDFPVTPTRQDLNDQGYIDPATGAFTKEMMKTAPNGQYGVIYANEEAMDGPDYFINLWTDNNPRIADVADQAPMIEGLTLTPESEGEDRALVVAGSARDPDEGDFVAGVMISLVNLTESISYDPVDVPGNGAAQLAFNVRFDDLVAGLHEATVAATDGQNNVRTVTQSVAIDVGENQPPVLTLVSARATSGACVAADGTVQDSDGQVTSVEVTIMGMGARAATLAGEAWSFEQCNLLNGTYRLFAQAFDDAGAASQPSPTEAVDLGGGEAEVASGTLTDHCNDGRVARWTDLYFEYRDKYCVQSGWNWECESFDLYRCEGEDAWTDEPLACGGGEVPQVSLSVEMSVAQPTVVVSGPLTLDVQVTNSGPDGASAVWIDYSLPASLSYQGSDPRCTRMDSAVICHLDQLAAGASVDVAIDALARVVGEVHIQVAAYSAQSGEAATAEDNVLVEEGTVDGGTQTDGGSETDAGSGTDAGGGTDAGQGKDAGTSDAGPKPDAGNQGASDGGSNYYDFRGGEEQTGCGGCGPHMPSENAYPGLLLLALLLASLRLRTRS